MQFYNFQTAFPQLLQLGFFLQPYCKFYPFFFSIFWAHFTSTNIIYLKVRFCKSVSWPKIGEAHYHHAKLRLPDKVLQSKGWLSSKEGFSFWMLHYFLLKKWIMLTLIWRTLHLTVYLIVLANKNKFVFVIMHT